MTYRVNQNDLISVQQPLKTAERQALPSNLGECYVDRQIIEPGIAIAYSSYTPTQDLVEESTIETQDTRFSLTFGLSGQSLYQCKSALAEDLHFSAQHTTLSTFGNSKGERWYKQGEKTNQFRILVNGNSFERLGIPFPRSADRIAYPQQHQHVKISQNTAIYLHRLVTLMQSSLPQQPLEKHILVFNLLSEALASLPSNLISSQQAFHHRDEEKIIAAKNYMISNMSLPITLSNVCQSVGISESKLKQGVKAIYQTSPHQLLLQIRMEKAWELLMMGNTVSQTAYLVGYQHASNFSAAFRRYYGHSPKQVSDHF